MAIGHSAIGLSAIGHSAIELLAIGHLAIGTLAIGLLAMTILAILLLAMSILAINVKWQSRTISAAIFHCILHQALNLLNVIKIVFYYMKSIA